MKKIALILFLLLLLPSCSVQEDMSPLIFAERLETSDENISIDIKNAFFEDDKFICFACYSDSELVFEISTDDNGNADKISLACTQTDKADEFVLCATSVIDTYAPDENLNEIVKNIFAERKLKDECVYYETQWYSYSAVMSSKGLYFSVENKKLTPQSEIEFSLKQNDIVDY